MIYKNKNFLIAGVSLSGMSSAKLLLKKQANVFLYDDKPIKNIEQLKKEGAVDVSHIPFNKIINDIYCIIKSPGVPIENKLTEYALSKGIPIISEIELGWYNYKGVSLAVTGTNGKSTVTSLIDYILKIDGKTSYLCGNIGVPYTNFCNKTEDSYCCIEVSSFQLDNCYEFKPHICSVLNISEDHINRHHDMDNYIKAKLRILQNQKETEYCVLNFDCEKTRQFFEKAKSKVYWFSGRQKVKGAYLQNGILKFCEEEIINSKDLKIIGYHNILNCLAAICFAKLLNIKNDIIKKALSTFNGIPHRLQYVGSAKNIKFYNDSKATNVESTLTAVNAIKDSTVLLLGGYDKNCDFKSFFKELKKYKNIYCCIFFGSVKDRLINDAVNAGYKNYIVCENFEKSVYKAYSICKEKGAVLLSPACASFDEFENFEQRGNKFIKMVKEIINAC